MAEFARLEPDQNKRKDSSIGISFLLYRLLDPAKETLRNAVREVHVGQRINPPSLQFASVLTSSNTLPNLVIALPNLRYFRYELSFVHMNPRAVLIKPRRMNHPISFTEEFVYNLSHHEKRPELHFRREDGTRVVTAPMPCATTLEAQVNPFWEDHGPKSEDIGTSAAFLRVSELAVFFYLTAWKLWRMPYPNTTV